ncbi:MAG: MFS transporter [Actinobacteria bacterium]|jgi:MFS family permease|nr:MFS transporter [Actinomycetota bacterium]
MAVQGRTSLRALLTANAISLTGNKMTLLVIPWFVLETTGSPSRTALAGFFAFLPIPLSSLLGGPLIDRVGFKRMSIIADLSSATTVAAIPLLHATIGIEFWQLLVLVFLGALLDAPGGTARSSLLPEIAEEAGTTLERATSLEDAISRASGLFGAPVAGVLIGLIGSANVLWVDAGTFIVSAALVMRFVHDRPVSEDEIVEPSRYLDELRSGLRFIRKNRLLLMVILTVTVTNFLDGAVGSVVMPVYVKERFGDAASLGMILGVWGGGAVLGSLAFGWLGERFSRRTLFITGFLAIAVQGFVLAAFPPLWAILVFMLSAGFLAGPINPIMGTVILERTPKDLRGRVIGASIATSWMAIPLGILAGGAMIEAWGLRPTLIAIASLYTATVLTALINPGTKDLNRTPSEPSVIMD